MGMINDAQMATLIQTAATVFKIIIMLVIAINVPPIMTWVERRQGALVQRRRGPNRVGLFGWPLLGLLQPVADTVKLLFKEDYFPTHAHKLFYFLAPVLVSTVALTAVMGIPLGDKIIVCGETISLQPVSLNVGLLFLLAMSSLGVYGVALAGWSSYNRYALLGSLRSSAQMISYELSMGLALVPPILIAQTLDLQKMVDFQGNFVWGILYAPVSFVILVITMFAETNRLPFDLAEGEAELVAGFLVEYGGMRWSQFFLGEYVMMFALSALIVCLFLGGYQLPFLSHADLVIMLQSFLGVAETWALAIAAVIGLIALLVKISFFLLLFSHVRFTLPRFRYDQLMDLGWKILLPLALANVLVTAIVVALVRF